MSGFEDFMNKIGFSGCGDHTGVGKTIFLSLLFMGFTTLFVYFFINELLVGNPSFLSGFNAYITLGVSAVVAFIAVFWRHKILIVLYCLISVICVFNIVHIIAIEKNKAYPAVVREWFGASEENLQKVQTLRAERLARTTYPNNEETGVPPGAIITILQSTNNTYRVKFRYKGKEDTIGTSAYTYLRVDRTYKLSKAVDLFSGDSASSQVLSEIPKGQKVELTGDSSADASMIEVLYNNEKGWIASDNLFAPILIKSEENLRFEIKMPSIPFAFIALALIALLYFIYFRKALKQYKAYNSEKRDEFIWFKNYIQKYGDPSASSAFWNVNNEMFKIIIACVISYAFGFVINLLLAVLYTQVYHSIPAQFEFVLPNIGTVLAPLGAVISAWVIWHSNARDVIKTECPHCGCPESYAMTSRQNVVDGERNDKTTVTTKTRNTATGYTTSESNSYYNLVYVGRVIEKYKCFNCKQTDRKEHNEEWKGPPGILSGILKDASRPDESLVEFNNDSLEELSSE